MPVYYDENDTPIALEVDERAAQAFLDIYAVDNYDADAPARLVSWCAKQPDPVPTTPPAHNYVCIEGGWYRQDDVDAVIWGVE